VFILNSKKMFKKLLLTATLFAVSFTVVNAQDFVLKADTMTKNTTGVTTITNVCETDAVIFYNYVYNNTTATLPAFHWQIIQKSLPFGWYVCQFCDNNLCRTGTSPEIANNQEVIASEIEVGDSTAQLEPAITVPADADNGVGILRVRVWTANTTDTATYIINKTPTGISKIAVNDTRVNIYPNPANNSVLIYAEKSLNPANVSVISISGQTVYNTAFNVSKEVSDINISALSKGTYMVRLTDTKGQLITSRKFIKE
jgi:hypothetical protein